MVIEQLGTSAVRVLISREELLLFGVNFETLESSGEETRHLILEILRLSKASEMLESKKLFVEAFARDDGSCLLYVSSCNKSGGVICCEPEDAAALFSLCSVPMLCEKVASSSLHIAGGKYCLKLTAIPGTREDICGLLGEFGKVREDIPSSAKVLIPSEAVELICELGSI